MASATYAVPLADLKRGPIRVTWTMSQDWLRRTLQDTEASPAADGEVQVELSANGSRVVVRGRATVTVTMPCARTLEPVEVALSPEIFLLLDPAPAHDPGSHGTRVNRRQKGGRGRRSADRPQRRAAPGRTPAGSSSWTDDPTLSPEDAALDTYEGELVVLDGYLREFILLELPMKVQRSDLPPDEDAAIGPSPSEEAARDAEQPLDPRLAPLAEIASRLRQDKE